MTHTTVFVGGNARLIDLRDVPQPSREGKGKKSFLESLPEWNQTKKWMEDGLDGRSIRLSIVSGKSMDQFAAAVKSYIKTKNLPYRVQAAPKTDSQHIYIKPAVELIEEREIPRSTTPIRSRRVA